jgi:predicted nucleic acid-binding protein
VAVADVDRRAAEAFASLVDELRRIGARVPTNDLWIAAVALVHGLTIVTCDTDFLRIRRVAVTLVERA